MRSLKVCDPGSYGQNPPPHNLRWHDAASLLPPMATSDEPIRSRMTRRSKRKLAIELPKGRIALGSFLTA
ncbi:MAG TPA: hypothetical protein VEZ17_07405 [Chitinophagaceae bacterium]|nr:hypothetical protein [Chitinophagaceae bacterium]